MNYVLIGLAVAAVVAVGVAVLVRRYAALAIDALDEATHE